MRPVYLWLGAVLALSMTLLVEARAQAAPVFDPQNVIADDIQTEALGAYRRHAARGAFRGSEMVIVDYRKPSSAPRLYILSLTTGAVEAYYVAHGRGSDPSHTQVAMRLSDAPSTGMSSVGAFRGLERYQSPENGPALRLAGLDWTNANAYDRLIVFHTAGYFDPAQRRFGRSCGCFVVTRQAMERVYGVLADGGFLYAGPAALHDRTASPARDCNPHCGGNCSAPLIAAAKKARPTLVARALPAPTPRAKPLPATPLPAEPIPAAPPVAVAAAAFVAPVPHAKPDFALPPAAAGMAAAPIPQAKPDLPAATAVAGAQDTLGTDAPVPHEKPAFRPTLDAAAVLADAARVPDPLPGEIPVPIEKPSGLRQVAELTP